MKKHVIPGIVVILIAIIILVVSFVTDAATDVVNDSMEFEDRYNAITAMQYEIVVAIYAVMLCPYGIATGLVAYLSVTRKEVSKGYALLAIAGFVLIAAGMIALSVAYYVFSCRYIMLWMLTSWYFTGLLFPLFVSAILYLVQKRQGVVRDG